MTEAKKMSDAAVSTNPYSRLMALQKMGIVDNYEQIRNYPFWLFVVYSFKGP